MMPSKEKYFVYLSTSDSKHCFIKLKQSSILSLSQHKHNIIFLITY